jgi:hypothetical protein
VVVVEVVSAYRVDVVVSAYGVVVVVGPVVVVGACVE